MAATGTERCVYLLMHQLGENGILSRGVGGSALSEGRSKREAHETHGKVHNAVFAIGIMWQCIERQSV